MNWRSTGCRGGQTEPDIVQCGPMASGIDHTSLHVLRRSFAEYSSVHRGLTLSTPES
jgi:hypothetical protein